MEQTEEVRNAQTDRTLAERASHGDVAAYETLVRKYERFVCTTAFSVVKNREDAYDVSQEVFLKVWHTVGTFKGESRFSSWLYRVTYNAALDFLRKDKKKRETSLTVTDEDGESVIRDVPDESVSAEPEKALMRAEKQEMLYRALDELTEEHRTVIRLRDIEGRTYGEIARMLELEDGTVKSRLFRARESLKRVLERENYF